MSFTSHAFLFYFLPGALVVYHLTPRRPPALRKTALLVLSYFFYAWLDPRLVLLLLATTVVNHRLVVWMARSSAERVRARWLAASLIINLGVLAFFKYAVFILEALDPLLQLSAFPGPRFEIALRAGISFFTFKIISYTIDVHRGEPPARSFLDLAVYIAFFPQLLSGPIQRFGTIDRKAERAASFAAQLESLPGAVPRLSFGAALFILGFAKKVLLADVLGKVADAAFSAAAPGTFDAWFGALAYSLQIYIDFSAYSEMAIGVGHLLGLECPRNFNAPCLATGFTDFWRRWHISLSSWFRDYLYVALGGNRKGAARSYLNLVIVFLLCGLWHGARWTFVAWGIYHGLFLLLERSRGRRTLYAVLPRAAQVAVTFLLVTVGWVFFRSETLTDAFLYIAAMFTPKEPAGGSLLLDSLLYTRTHLLVMASGLLLVFQPVQAADWAQKVTRARAVLLVFLFCISILTLFTQSFRSFLYFQF
ncbi:MAG: MBOAT family protein [Planctomycetes bacterium]|nr:MBOAT family protein [Planctomycetota bacterium]